MGYGSDHIHLLFNIWYREFEFTPAYENNLPQIDHIRMNVMRYRDAERNQLANCMLLTKEENGAGGKGDKPPDQWFVGQRAESPYLRMHLIPEDRSLWKIDRFEDFIAERKKLIMERFKPLLLSAQTQGTSGIVTGGQGIPSKRVAALIEAGALEDGALLTLMYRGQKFTGTARCAGIELPNGVFSPSEAAIQCYAKIGSSRPTENGWRVWRTASGSSLNDLFEAVSGPAGVQEDVT